MRLIELVAQPLLQRPDLRKHPKLRLHELRRYE